MLKTLPNCGVLHIELLLSCPATKIAFYRPIIERAYCVVIVAYRSLMEEICESLDIRSKVDIWLKCFDGYFLRFKFLP